MSKGLFREPDIQGGRTSRSRRKGDTRGWTLFRSTEYVCPRIPLVGRVKQPLTPSRVLSLESHDFNPVKVRLVLLDQWDSYFL